MVLKAEYASKLILSAQHAPKSIALPLLAHSA